MYIDLHVKYPLFLSCFREICYLHKKLHCVLIQKTGTFINIAITTSNVIYFFLNLTVAELVKKKSSSYYGTLIPLPLSHNPANFSTSESIVCNIYVTLFIDIYFNIILKPIHISSKFSLLSSLPFFKIHFNMIL